MPALRDRFAFVPAKLLRLSPSTLRRNGACGREATIDEWHRQWMRLSGHCCFYFAPLGTVRLQPAERGVTAFVKTKHYILNSQLHFDEVILGDVLRRALNISG
jgi:hypothetical protein